MARGVNRVILLGNLGKAPEVRYFPNGDAVANTSIATSESWTDKQTGEKKERTEWTNLVFMKKLAEIAGQYLHKGSKVYVEGSLRTRMWEKDGQKHYSTEVIVRDLQMLDGKPADGDQRDARTAQPTASQQRTATRAAAPPADDGLPPFEDDDIPF